MGVVRYSCERVIFPVVFYFVFFCILTFPSVWYFSTHLSSGAYDGFQNVWNLWWVNKAVTQLHCSPWYTTYLHWPYGVSLFGQTLNPFNGFLAIVLLKFMTLIQTHNLIMILSFVTGGWTAFLLALYISRAYWGSLLAGFLFTFSSFHFVHALGHLQLVSLEWIPVFILCSYILLRKPSLILAALTALTLFLVILCDYYYFFYCVLSFLLMLVWFAWRRRDGIFFLRNEYALSMAVFLIGVCLTSGVIVMSLAHLNRIDPFLGAHASNIYSIDAFDLFIPGIHWKFASMTKMYWSRLPEYAAEHSIYLGYAVFFMLAYGLVKRRRLKTEGLGLWYVIFFTFFILGLGPTLNVCGKPLLKDMKLPYAFLEQTVGFLKLSGCPVRMAVMLDLSAAVIFACGFGALFAKGRRKGLLCVLLLVLLIEHMPKPLPATDISVPAYVEELKKIPGKEGIIDLVASPSRALYYQTIHEKPMAFGYVSRTPVSVFMKDRAVQQAIKEKRFQDLYRTYHLRYLLVDQGMEADPTKKKMFIQDLSK